MARRGLGGTAYTKKDLKDQVGVFKNCRVESIGRGIGSSRGKASGIYKSSRAAKKVAAAIAKKASGGGSTRFRKRR